MILTFNGNVPEKKFIELGVTDDHKGEKLIMQIKDTARDMPDLNAFTPYLIIANKDMTFADKVRLEAVQSGGYIELVYEPTREVTSQGSVDMQLVFELVTPEDTLTWKSIIFIAWFADRIDYNGKINQEHPDELRELTQRVVGVEQNKAEVMQFASSAEFPNIGNENTLYIDTGQNKIYRFDPAANTYYAVGLGVNDIKVIQCKN